MLNTTTPSPFADHHFHFKWTPQDKSHTSHCRPSPNQENAASPPHAQFRRFDEFPSAPTAHYDKTQFVRDPADRRRDPRRKPKSNREPTYTTTRIALGPFNGHLQPTQSNTGTCKSLLDRIEPAVDMGRMDVDQAPPASRHRVCTAMPRLPQSVLEARSIKTSFWAPTPPSLPSVPPAIIHAPSITTSTWAEFPPISESERTSNPFTSSNQCKLRSRSRIVSAPVEHRHEKYQEQQEYQPRNHFLAPPNADTQSNTQPASGPAQSIEAPNPSLPTWPIRTLPLFAVSRAPTFSNKSSSRCRYEELQGSCAFGAFCRFTYLSQPVDVNGSGNAGAEQAAKPLDVRSEAVMNIHMDTMSKSRYCIPARRPAGGYPIHPGHSGHRDFSLPTTSHADRAVSWRRPRPVDEPKFKRARVASQPATRSSSGLGVAANGRSLGTIFASSPVVEQGIRSLKLVCAHPSSNVVL
jgi:hypothetical protein